MRFPLLSRLIVLAWVAILALAISLGCKLRPGPSPDSASDSASASASLAEKPHPTSAAEARALKKRGISWTNGEIRVYYNQLVSTIGPSDEQRKKEGLPAEERARRAFEVRHEARLTSRAMMANDSEVDDLRRRDQEKYGNPDGPTFEQLVESGKKKGATGDAVYEGIVASAQRTDEGVNAAFGIQRKP
jgi:hypothetical protein